MKTNEIKVEPKKEIKTEPTQLVNYESDGSDDSDPENPSCMAFWYGFCNHKIFINLAYFFGIWNHPPPAF